MHHLAPNLTKNPYWPSVLSAYQALAGQSLRDLFAQDNGRFEKMHACAGAITLDYSRQCLNTAALDACLKLLDAQGFAAARAALFTGQKVNTSEGRAALHMALRAEKKAVFKVGDTDVMPSVLAAREKMLAFADAVRKGVARGATGKTFKHIIHVGIGGSDLGPRLLVDALADGRGPHIHFVMNVEGHALKTVMNQCAPEETLVLLASKTFTTSETMRNAETLQEWLTASLKEKALTHFAALTAVPDKAKVWGISEAAIFPFWEWVGGRFSVWSSVGLPAAIAMGAEQFSAFLAGGAAMDAHFLNAPAHQNIPVLMALLSLWNINVRHHHARAVLPYTERLGLLPAYLQQLEMESLGKSVNRDGGAIDYATAPAVFGMTGTPAQHAFMQALHQGTETIPAEFIMVKNDDAALPAHQAMLNANALAQAEALAFGRTADEVRSSGETAAARVAQKTFAGNRPSSVLVLEHLSPATLGQLIALYEHKVFTESVLWNLNPFDQWGVELGKVLAGPILEALSDKNKNIPASAGIISQLR